MLSSSKVEWLRLGADRHLLYRQEEQCRALRRHQLHVTVVKNGGNPLCLCLRCAGLKSGQMYGGNRLRPEQLVCERVDFARAFGSESDTSVASQMKSYRNENLKCRRMNVEGLSQHLLQNTGIPGWFLCNISLGKPSVAQRMSWTSQKAA